MKLGSGHAGNEPKVVTPCVGVWIEMQWFLVTGWSREMSLPAWECGLKFYEDSTGRKLHKVTPCVGVWIEIFCKGGGICGKKVTPCVGVWIEMK